MGFEAETKLKDLHKVLAKTGLMIFVLSMIIVFANPAFSAAPLDQALDQLAADLVEGLPLHKVERVAVLDPRGPGDDVSEFGVFLVEEMNRRLTLLKAGQRMLESKPEKDSGYFTVKAPNPDGKSSLSLSKIKVFKSVVERRRLYDLIQQKRIEFKDVFDPETMAPVGKMVGVDGLVFLTVRDLGPELLVSARLVSAVEGVILTGGKALIEKDDPIKVMLTRQPGADVLVMVDPPREGVSIWLAGKEKSLKKESVTFKDTPQGIQTLIVKAPCFETCKLPFYLTCNRSFNIKLEPKRTVLQVSVNPADAKVLVDGGKAIPLDAQGTGSITLPAGVHALTASAKGYPAFSRTFELSRPALTLPIDLEKTKQKVCIAVYPEQAEAFWDGERVALDADGRFTALVHQGPHTLRARAKNHIPQTMPVKVDRDLNLNLSLAAKKHPFEVRFTPPEAVVELDGRVLPVSSPQVAFARITAGAHTLQVRAPGYDEFKKDIEIPNIARQEVKLAKRPLRLEFAAIYEQQGRIRNLVQGARLYSNGNYAVAVKALENAYVYVFQIDGLGKVSQLFPDPLFKEHENPVQPGAWHWMPPKSHWAYLDDAKGMERIYFLASRRPSPELENLQSSLLLAKDELMLASLGKDLVEQVSMRGRAGVRPAGKIKVTPKGKVFEAAGRVIESCGAEWVYVLEFEHK